MAIYPYNYLGPIPAGSTRAPAPLTVVQANPTQTITGVVQAQPQQLIVPAQQVQQPQLNVVQQPQPQATNYNPQQPAPIPQPNYAPIPRPTYAPLPNLYTPNFSNSNTTPTSTTSNFMPSTVLNLAKDVAQGTARSGGSVGATISGMFGGSTELRPEGKFQQAIFGQEPVKSLETRILEAVPKVQEFSKKYTGKELNKFQAAGVSLPLILGLTALDFTGAGGQKNVIKALVKVNKLEDVLKILKKANVSDELAKIYAPRLVEVTEPKVVENLLKNIKDAQVSSAAKAELPRLGKQLQPPKLFQESSSYKPTIPQADKERKFITSVKESPNIAPEVKSAVQGTYDPITNAETLAKARQLVAEKPEAALQKIYGETLDADTTATALAYIEKAQAAGNIEQAVEVAEATAKKLTQGGQFIQAASMLNKLSPEGVLVYASKRGAKLTPDIARKITEQAKKVQDLPFGYEKFKETQNLANDIAKAAPISKVARAKDFLLELANLPRAFASSFFDFSFGLRQGLVAGVRNPKEFSSAFKAQFKAFTGEKGYDNLMNQVVQHPDFKLASEAGVAFSDINSKMALREERYMSSLAEKITGLPQKLPVVGKYIPNPIRATNRAYTGMANKLRMDTFSKLAKNLKATDNPELLSQIASFVNDITGRGDLPKILEKASPLLNAVFYSPRLMASRVNLLNPFGVGNGYLFQSAPIRNEYLKTMTAFSLTMATILGAASLIPGVSVETDSRSADWGKIKIGDTRLDIMGGFQQYIRIFSQIATNKYVNSSTGKVVTLGEGYRPLTRKDILFKGFESKESPIFSLLSKWFEGQDFEGNKVNMPKEALKAFIPMLASDLYEIYKEDPELLPLGVFGVFGTGLQSYGPPEAYKKNNEINASADPKAAFEQLKKENPTLAEKVKTVKIQENFTEFDWGLTYLGVENGERAQFLVQHFNKLPEDQRAAAYADLRKKRLISERVADQIKYSLEHPDFKPPQQ